MPTWCMRVSQRGGKADAKSAREQHCPPNNAAKKAQERICRVVYFLAQETPQRRVPQNRVLAPKSKFLPKQAVDTKSRGNRNEYASVPPEVIPAYSEFLVPDERCVNAKAGDDEENDD